MGPLDPMGPWPTKTNPFHVFVTKTFREILWLSTCLRPSRHRALSTIPEVPKISEKTTRKPSEIAKNRGLGWPRGLKKEVLEPGWGCLGAPGHPKAKGLGTLWF